MRTGGPARRARWVGALLAEIDQVGAAGPWEPFDTVYLGGGTPSLLEPAQLEEILAALRRAFTPAADPALSVEANPEDASAERLAGWRALGATTLSLGVQALDDDRLRFLGRAHSAAQARAAVERALAAGFATVSADLIYGLPGERPEDLARELERAIALGVPHLSAYQLSMPERTLFGKRLRRGEMVEMAEEGQAERFVQVHETLAAAGYTAYEVSNFARAAGHRSRHNQKYWRHVPYLGLGPAAHSFRDGRRWWNERRADDYEARLARGERPVAGEETLTPGDLALEARMLGLRTSDGVPAQLCAPESVDRLFAEGLLRREGERVVATLPGWAIADALALQLGPA